ncbi:nucleotide-diphospho-sugar transferase [Gautieria morchelliformis]|nr:nucleotide-diphospho-sugar transferase [Gautieria morchelliformis]
MKAAYATLLTRESYLPGTLVLNYSLQAVASKYHLVVMVTPELSESARDALSKEKISIKEIARLDPREGSHTLAADDARFKDTWTKLRAFELVEYDRIAFLDSDMLVLKNMDDLLDLELPGTDWIAACNTCTCNPHKFPHYPKDWIPENCAYTPLKVVDGAVVPASDINDTSRRTYGLLNSGTVRLQPSEALSRELYNFLATSPLVPTFSFPDQDLLAHFFKGKWKRLPYVYNSIKTLRTIHPLMWRDEDARCLHYLLNDKPWLRPRGSGGDYEVVNGWWWDRFDALKAAIKETHPESLSLIEALVTVKN